MKDRKYIVYTANSWRELVVMMRESGVEKVKGVYKRTKDKKGRSIHLMRIPA